MQNVTSRIAKCDTKCDIKCDIKCDMNVPSHARQRGGPVCAQKEIMDGYCEKNDLFEVPQ